MKIKIFSHSDQILLWLYLKYFSVSKPISCGTGFKLNRLNVLERQGSDIIVFHSRCKVYQYKAYLVVSIV
ncbi:hypothetical protein [Sulfurisphaera ohwakuensis]|uniref:hypothetical protein n=1 Tax=Sulfurisphaera ohwakuensis TaxID=69656 RepID=UPI0036F1BD4F